MEEFTSLTLQALTRRDLGTLDFVYTLQRQAEGRGLGGASELAWKKYIVEEDIKFQLGSVNLDPLPSPTAQHTLLDHALRQTQVLGGLVAELQQQTERLMAERDRALARLERCVAAQETLEADLFAKFKLVLNSKKAKIRNLLSQLAEAPAVAMETMPSSATLSHSPPAVGSAAAGGDRTEAGSEEDTPPPPTLPASHPAGDSLFETDTILLSPPARRKRGRGQSKRATGLIPIPQPPSAFTRSRARSASSTSQTSEREADAEDLLGQL